MSTKEVLNGWEEYLKLAIPSVLCILILYTPTEIAILLAGTIDPNEQAVITVILDALFLFNFIALGDRDAAVTYISNLIGASRPK